MRVSYVSKLDPTDPRSFSGTTSHMIGALRTRGVEVNPIGPLAEPWPMWFNAKHAYYKLVRRKSYARDREPAVLRAYAKQVSGQLGDCDIVLSRGTVGIAKLECRQPIAVWTDATFAGMLDFYWCNLAPASIRQGMAMEQEALDRCSVAAFSSQWAADGAIRHYKLDPRKVHVVEYGGNLGKLAEPSEDEVEASLEERPTDRCELLFIGVDWERKGADHALAVAAAIHRAGLRCTLTMVGCQPPKGKTLPSFARCVDFISKATPAGCDQMGRLLRRSHFLILPSRAEACARVLAEANAYGLPCVTTNVGGIPSAIRDGVNGLTFDLADDAATWAEAMLKTLGRPDDYRAMCRRAWREYQARMNWRVAGARMETLLDTALQSGWPRPGTQGRGARGPLPFPMAFGNSKNPSPAPSPLSTGARE